MHYDLFQPSPEKDDLEPWLVVEMDSLLSEAWLHGKEEAFTQLIHLILTEDVSGDSADIISIVLDIFMLFSNLPHIFTV